jgi:hypothetical protein
MRSVPLKAYPDSDFGNRAIDQTLRTGPPEAARLLVFQYYFLLDMDDDMPYKGADITNTLIA